MLMWTDGPVHDCSIELVRGILSSDKKFSQYSNVDNWFERDEKLSILQNYNHSVKAARAYWSTASDVGK
jgi:hypothetical protein